MLRLCCTAQFVAALVLTGCGTAQIFTDYEVNEDPSVESAPWPRLVDTPAAPAVGSYSAAVPDPAKGAAVHVELRTVAGVAAARARNLSAPILTDAEREALTRRTREAQQRRAGTAADEDGTGDDG